MITGNTFAGTLPTNMPTTGTSMRLMLVVLQLLTGADRQNIRFNGLDLVMELTAQDADIVGYEFRFGANNTPEMALNAGTTENATLQVAFGDQAGGGNTHGGVFMTMLLVTVLIGTSGLTLLVQTLVTNPWLNWYTDRGGTAWNNGDANGDFDTIGAALSLLTSVLPLVKTVLHLAH